MFIDSGLFFYLGGELQVMSLCTDYCCPVKVKRLEILSLILHFL